MPQGTSIHRRRQAHQDCVEGFSGLFVPSARARKKALVTLSRFDACMESFLEMWTIRMQAAGYLSFTTARREDCIEACRQLLEPVIRHAKSREPVSFETLRENADGWADVQIETGLRHCRRGITVSMYLGCYKTFIMAVEDALHVLPRLCAEVPEDHIPATMEFVRLHAHVFEVLWTGRAMRELAKSAPQVGQDELLRLLTLEKCRFENIFNATSDGVLVMDETCRIITCNQSLRQYAGENIEGRFIWDALGLEGESPEEFLRYYPVGQPAEIALFDDRLFFRISVSSLGGMSLASAGEYVVLLANITPQVLQREMIEKANLRQAEALEAEQRRLEELSITLRTVLSNIHADQTSIREELSKNVRRVLLPALDRMASEQDAQIRRGIIELVRNALVSTLSGGEDDVDAGLSRLTLAELKVCRLVRAGHSTKEVAALLNISPDTVQTHRRSIRRKLGLRGRDTQLSVHLLKSGGPESGQS